MRVLEDCGVALRGAKVLDVGSGTGKLMRLLSQGGAVVTGVDVSLGMLQVAKRWPGGGLVRGLAERLPFKGQSFAFVSCGQAFQWFDYDNALQEFRRVLASGGKLLLLWNERDRSDPTSQAIEKSVEAYRKNSPRWRGVDWTVKITERGAFSRPSVRAIQWEREVHWRLLVDLIMSRSYIARQSTIEQGRIRRSLCRIIRGSASRVGEWVQLGYLCRIVVAGVD